MGGKRWWGEKVYDELGLIFELNLGRGRGERKGWFIIAVRLAIYWTHDIAHNGITIKQTNSLNLVIAFRFYLCRLLS